jgi:large subunit ribosomal protein L4
MTAKKTGATVKVDFPAEIFDVETNVALIHQVVVGQQAAARQGTHATKTRGEVRGGGRKPYKQKGTGRARQGSLRAPQFAGGGVVHGPQPRDYDQRTPKKMKAAALRGALSDRARAGRIHVVESLLDGDKPSTKDAVAALADLAGNRRQLVVLERADALTWLSLRNVASVHLLAVDQLNTYDVLLCDDVIFTKGAFDAFVNGTAAATARPATIVEAPAHDETVVEDTAVPEDTPTPEDSPAVEDTVVAADSAVADSVVEADEYEGSAKPLESGEAPEGFEIKGNKDSKKFHAPGGQWYDATEAEVWFRTAADAEAAGFVEAGSKKSVEQTHAEEDDQ